MKKIYYTHIGKVFNSPEAVICEVIRIIENEKLAPRLSDYTLSELLNDGYDYSERLGELGALVNTLFELGDASIWPQEYDHLKLPRLYRIHHEYAAAFLDEPDATPNSSDDLKTALSVWYWDEERCSSLFGAFHWVVTKGATADLLLNCYKDDYFAA